METRADLDILRAIAIDFQRNKDAVGEAVVFAAVDEIRRYRAQNVGRDVVGDGLGDGRRICEALGFDPTNHHNALKCPYCNPTGLALAQPAPNVGENVGQMAQSWNCTS